MKMFLVGGTVIEVSDKDYVLVVSHDKAGFHRITERCDSYRSYSIETEEFIVPRSIVERIELCKK